LILFVAFEYNFSSLLCLFSGFISVLVGAIASIFQKKIKRLFAYSTISHTGFILLGTFGLSSLGFKSIFFYLLIYILMNISIFSILLGNKHAILKYIINWSYFFSRNIALSIVFSFILLSMAGIPPLAGFFSKLLIIISVIQQGYVIFSFFLVIFTCIGCYYYIRLLKIFYFGTNISGV
jgi:NADH-quinone oxidoreductase subunit N